MPEHIPVLVEEILAHFKPKNTDTLLDATLGLGGHAKAFLIAGGAQVVGFDADQAALAEAKRRLQEFGSQVTYVHDNFANIQKALTEHSSGQTFTHVLFDLGIGSHQLSDEARGFSFQGAGPLTMLYGTPSELPDSSIEEVNVLTRRLGRYPDVIDIIQLLSPDALAHLIRTYGEERFAGRIARVIHEQAKTITDAQELADLIKKAVPGRYEHGRIHPATRTFQALRIAVNRELEVISSALPQALDILVPGGMLAVISFHSLEDRIVKHFFKDKAKVCVCPPEQLKCTCERKPKVTIVTKRPIEATEEEIKQNPRSRSAKLRIAIKQKE